MLAQMRMVGLPEPERQHKFWPGRRFAFDFAYPDRMVAVECEGGVWTGGAHTRGKHFTSDAEKYNEAAIRGWVVIRATVDMIEDGTAIRFVERALGANQ